MGWLIVMLFVVAAGFVIAGAVHRDGQTRKRRDRASIDRDWAVPGFGGGDGGDRRHDRGSDGPGPTDDGGGSGSDGGGSSCGGGGCGGGS